MQKPMEQKRATYGHSAFFSFFSFYPFFFFAAQGAHPDYIAEIQRQIVKLAFVLRKIGSKSHALSLC